MQDILSENFRSYRFVNTITDALSGTDLCFVFRAYSETGPVQYTTRRKKARYRRYCGRLYFRE